MRSVNSHLFSPTDRMLRQFAALWIVFFGVTAALEVRHHRPVLALILAVLAATVGPLGLAWPRAIGPIFVAWMALARPIGWVVSHVILGLLFYGIFTPLALIFRLIGRDALVKRPKPDVSTYWRTKPTARDSSEYLRQF